MMAALKLQSKASELSAASKRQRTMNKMLHAHCHIRQPVTGTARRVWEATEGINQLCSALVVTTPALQVYSFSNPQPIMGFLESTPSPSPFPIRRACRRKKGYSKWFLEIFFFVLLVFGQLWVIFRWKMSRMRTLI
ncbi:uncharacterized protein LOC111780586 [Cucurbita pepo subsp. pepo]|uniref:uncharacterized protein LOC111780586 n=1 Tax=Cucurbita pepo subsp. pepo TaxID=3664 RepID=UPI000C9D484A|nr:uncharacterized protein LOC111780586 [Cucurbita pepo subsp. pepo]